MLVRTISEYLAIIDRIDRHYAREGSRHALIFRGLANLRYGLLPGIFRTFKLQTQNGTEDVPCYDAAERDVLHHFIKNAMSAVNIVGRNDTLTWLTYAQHFGAPTRLLDFSGNPLVSLYFCCKRELGQDGAVCVLHDGNYVRSLQLAQVPGRTKREVLDEIMLHIENPEVSCTKYPVTFIPHYIDLRMDAQSSRFLVWGSERAEFETFAEPCGSMLDGDDTAFFCKIRVDGHSKGNILRELSFLGINEKSLFPGLDGIGRYISQYYSKTTEDYDAAGE